MKVGLVDLYTSGHHLPYAHRIKQAIECAPGHEVDFVTLSETEYCRTLFDRDEVTFLDDPQSRQIEDREGEFVDVADELLGRFFTSEAAGTYDVVHFLFADDILGPLWKYCSSSPPFRVVGELNGNFFKRASLLRRRYLHPLFLRALRSPADTLIDAAVPEMSPHQSLWRDLYLYRCLRDGTFDHLLTHSTEASEYVRSVDPVRVTPITNLPYPSPNEFGNGISKRDARDELGLPQDDPVLLFFGTLRSEKGIHELLNALCEYQGPKFTMQIAGPPVTVTESHVSSTADASAVDVVTELEYITEPEVYYRAADALVLPYTREFGRECTSQTLGEACSAMRPVVVPDFGVVGRLTEEWELGATYDGGSKAGLVAAMATFAREGVPYSEEKMERYNLGHSVESVSPQLTAAYSQTASQQQYELSVHDSR